MGPIGIALTLLISCLGVLSEVEKCPENLVDESKLRLNKIVPALEAKTKTKGDAGKICVIGGSIEYTGAPYFAAISALKTGADLAYVITTENAAPVIKSYSPDLIVYPYLRIESLTKITDIIKKMDILVIGPGLGREDETLNLIGNIIKACRELTKPLVIDADGLYLISKNPLLIKDYPGPGIILTPNHHEARKLIESVPKDMSSTWHRYWGEFVSVLIKGETDKFYSGKPGYDWSDSRAGSGRRVAGQGDVLSGSLGTFYNWALKQKICDTDHQIQLAQSLAAFAAAKLTRTCNSLSFALHGRSMLASDMIHQIHSSFDDVFAH